MIRIYGNPQTTLCNPPMKWQEDCRGSSGIGEEISWRNSPLRVGNFPEFQGLGCGGASVDPTILYNGEPQESPPEFGMILV